MKTKEQRALESIKPELDKGWKLQRTERSQAMLVQPRLPGAKGDTVIFLGETEYKVAAAYLAGKK